MVVQKPTTCYILGCSKKGFTPGGAKFKNREIWLCKLQVETIGTGSFVNRNTWPPKGLSSEKSWYVIDRQSFGNDDCSGKNIEML